MAEGWKKGLGTFSKENLRKGYGGPEKLKDVGSDPSAAGGSPRDEESKFNNPNKDNGHREGFA